MELRQLEYLVAVVDEANFTRAAARVQVAPPAVSAQIRRLEHELGQPLLDRSARHVRPTDAGAAVLPFARDALTAVAGVRAAVDELAGLLRGHLRIAAMTFYSQHVDLPGLLAGFHRRHPAVEISLSAGSSDQLVAALRRGEHDLAFIGLGPQAPTDIAIHTVACEPLVAVVGAEHPNAGAEGIDLTTVAAGPLISLPRGTGLRAQLDHACAGLGIEPNIAFEAADPRMAAQLAAHGFGLALVPTSVAATPQHHLQSLPILEQTLQAHIALAWRTAGPTSPAALELINHVRRSSPQPTTVPT